MNLQDIIHRQPVPEPWAEGEKIPWNEPGFSGRMLQEHLSQAHDAASRRVKTIDRQVEWIHRAVLAGKPTRILDLGCGPGLYTQRLAKLGHECVGIDFSPASIAYAREAALADQARCSYIEGDVRSAELGGGYGLVMLIFGEFNTFRRADAALILNKAHRALAQNGRLLLEPHTNAAVRATGKQPSTWYSTESGLFADSPHICLKESFWDSRLNVSTERYYTIDALTSRVSRYASSMQAYTDVQYKGLLQDCGFGNVEFHPSLSGANDDTQGDFLAILCQKQSAT